MDYKFILSWTATVSQMGLLLTGSQVCFKIVKSGNTGQIALFPFVACCLSGILWTKYGMLIDDFPITFVSAAGMVSQSIYIFIYYVNTREKRSAAMKILWSFLGVTSVLSYIKYYVDDSETAITHLGLICSGFTVAVYGSPLVSLAQVVKKKSTEYLTFSLCLANFLVSMQWLMYGYIVEDVYIKLPNLLGVLLSVIQLSLFILYPSAPQRTVVYTPGSKPPKLEI